MLPIRLSDLPEAPLDVSQSGIFPVSDVPNDITYKLSLQQIPSLSENQNIKVKTISYTITKNDYNTIIYFNNEISTTVNLTIPNNNSKKIQPGYSIKIVRFNLGHVQLVADSGVTIHSPDGLYLRSQYSVSTLTKIDTNTWIVEGHLSPTALRGISGYIVSGAGDTNFNGTYCLAGTANAKNYYQKNDNSEYYIMYYYQGGYWFVQSGANGGLDADAPDYYNSSIEEDTPPVGQWSSNFYGIYPPPYLDPTIC